MHRLQRSKSTSNVEIKTSLSPFFSPKISRININQYSSSRASDSIKAYPICQQNPTQSLYNILIWNSEITSTILSLCDFQRILTLRLVSTIFYLTSTIATDRPSPLTNKAIIFFPYFQLSSNFQDNDDFKEKFTFAQNQNLEQHIIVSVNDLYHSPLKFNCIEKNKIKIILEINLYTELYQLNDLINNHIQYCTNSIKTINEIKFSQINTKNNSYQFNLSHACHSSSINSLLTTVSKNLDYFPNLTSLSTTYIGKNATRTLLAFHTLTSLSIGTISSGASVELTVPLDKLTTLSIGVICPGAILKLPTSLPNLFKLHIDSLLGEAIIELPDSLPNLSIFSIQGHLAALTISPHGLKSFAFEKPINNSTIDAFLKCINECMQHPHT